MNASIECLQAQMAWNEVICGNQPRRGMAGRTYLSILVPGKEAAGELAVQEDLPAAVRQGPPALPPVDRIRPAMQGPPMSCIPPVLPSPDRCVPHPQQLLRLPARRRQPDLDSYAEQSLRSRCCRAPLP